MSAFPYIGCKISLISKHGIRYEGTLFSIHAEDHTICLNSVRCFGTEGRRAKDNLPEVPAAADVFEYIMFRGSDIQDLTVCETSQQQAPAPPADPAIVSTNQAPASGPGGAPVAPVAPAPAVTIPAPQPKEESREGRNRAPRKPREHKPRDSNASLEGTGAHLASRRAKPAENPYVQPEGEYDFDAQNAGFDKSGLAEEFDAKLSMQPEERPQEGGFYQKSSFFDNISCDALDREEQADGQRRGKGFADMRKLDMETFGETFGRNHFRHRGKGSGGGGNRGGKGGNRRNNRRRGGGGQGGGQQGSNQSSNGVMRS